MMDVAIFEQPDDEQMALDGAFDIAVPFSLRCVAADGGRLEIEVYPSLRKDAEAFVRQFGSDPFSPGAIAWAKETFGAFLARSGFALGEEADDYFISHRLPGASCAGESSRLECVGELCNLTGYDIDALNAFGHLCFASVVDGSIVSAACTNSPVTDDMSGSDIEIGVETAPGYRGRGYGVSNVAALAKALSLRGCTALYECASGNAASVALVKKLGGVEYARNYYIVGIKE